MSVGKFIEYYKITNIWHDGKGGYMAKIPYDIEGRASMQHFATLQEARDRIEETWIQKVGLQEGTGRKDIPSTTPTQEKIQIEEPFKTPESITTEEPNYDESPFEAEAPPTYVSGEEQYSDWIPYSDTEERRTVYVVVDAVTGRLEFSHYEYRKINGGNGFPKILQTGGCIMTAIGAPLMLLTGLRKVRAYLPYWFVRGYYGFSSFVLGDLV